MGFLAFFEKNRGNTKDISITIRILQVYIKYFIDFEIRTVIKSGTRQASAEFEKYSIFGSRKPINQS